MAVIDGTRWDSGTLSPSLSSRFAARCDLVLSVPSFCWFLAPSMLSSILGITRSVVTLPIGLRRSSDRNSSLILDGQPQSLSPNLTLMTKNE
jgi:hypothetical protein